MNTATGEEEMDSKKNLILFLLVLCFARTGSASERHDQMSYLSPRTNRKTNAPVRVLNGVSMPRDFPTFEVAQYGETGQGGIFTTLENYLVILNNDGTPKFYRSINAYTINDLTLHSPGALSYVDGDCGNAKYIMMDKNYLPTNTLTCGHGYNTGGHDMIILPNGHTLFIAIERKTMDLSQIVPGGQDNAVVFVERIIELDKNKNIVFNWNGLDHYTITDMDGVNITHQMIQFGHINSMSLDYDGHLIISNRTFSEVTKINLETGEVIWRLGGKNSTFLFINDPVRLSWQHTARPVLNQPNHYTIFDNGNTRTPPYSRVVEYKIDMLNKSAEKVWEYRPSPDRYTSAQGSAQRLTNGNTLIGWGRVDSKLLTEVSPEKEIIFEINGIGASRVMRYEWEGKLLAPYLIAEPYYDNVTLIFNKFGDENVIQYKIYADTLTKPNTLIKIAGRPFVRLLPYDLPTNNTNWFFRVTSVDSSGEESPFSNTEKVSVHFVGADENMIYNGDFSKDTLEWELNTAPLTSARGIINKLRQYHLQIDDGGSLLDDVSLIQNGIKLMEGQTYSLEFDMSAPSQKSIETRIGHYFSYTQRLTNEFQHFEYQFTFNESDDYQTYLKFLCGYNDIDVLLDNVSLKQISTVVREKKENNTPDDFVLEQNYPNPFNPSTTIQYAIVKAGPVELKVYDLLGHEKEILVSESLEPGDYQVKWSPKSLGSGIYVYQLESNGSVMRKKVLYLK